MANPYEIPWAPPDIGPGASFIASVLNQNRQNDRADEYARMQRDAMAASERRISHEAKRQEEQDKYKRALDAFNARPMLERMAQRHPGAASVNPYGYTFEEGFDLPANVEGPELSPTAEAARFMVAQQPQATSPQATAMHPTLDEIPTPEMPYRGADTRSLMGQHNSGAGPVENDEEAAIADGLATPMMMQAAVNSFDPTPGPQGKRRIYGNVNGARYEVPEMNDTSGFGEKYDAIYRRALQEPGVTPEEAYRFVAKMAHDDQAEEGRNVRLSRSLGQRTSNREDQQSFQAEQNRMYRSEPTTAEERERLARIRASAGSQFKQEGANDRIFSLLDRRAKAVRETGQFSKLAANDKVVRGIAANLASGTEGLQHKDAQIQLARYFRQAQPTEGEMHLLYNNLGGWTDNFDQFKAKVMSGDLSPEQLRQMKKSAKTVIREHEEDKKRFYEVARRGLGPKSGLDEAPDQAQAQFDMMAAELGIEPGELPPLYETEGGITLGTKQAPKTKRRGKGKTVLDQLEAQLDALGAK